ncbi:hypothetical protein CHELA1G11_11906 [Hyphomicrobiales bacterium]|nr:hypothetical protein CHELA1G11_11906 [Hyphomicrobiales bacterium]CAH1664642.1 hypothetical protein CHELA1G2_12405 [Hyphomicrobiales bacterium]
MAGDLGPRATLRDFSTVGGARTPRASLAWVVRCKIGKIGLMRAHVARAGHPMVIKAGGEMARGLDAEQRERATASVR